MKNEYKIAYALGILVALMAIGSFFLISQHLTLSKRLAESAAPAFGAPFYTQQRTILPETTNKYELGTSTKYWYRAFVTTLCLSGDCKSAWPTGSGSGSGSVGTSSPGQIGQLAMFTTSGATPELIAPVATGTLSASYPLLLNGSTVILGTSRTLSSALGTTTANAWSALQQFNGSASSSQFSVLGPLTIGTTSTTTILGNATSTFNGGINIPTGKGCFAINGTCVSGGSGTPAGSIDNIQYNNNGVFGGSADFQWDDTNKVLGLATSTDLAATIKAGTHGLNLTVEDAPDGSAAGGINIYAGTGGTTSGRGGTATLEGGDAQAGASDGGNVFLLGGSPSGAGTSGHVIIQEGPNFWNAELISTGLSGNQTFTFPNQSGTFALGTGSAGNCAQWSDTNILAAAAAPCGSGGGTWPFTITTYNGQAAQSTSTLLWLKGSALSLAASSSVLTYASSTALTATNLYSSTASTTNQIISSAPSALLKTGADGTVSAYGGSSCTNQFPRSVSALGAWTCASVSLTADITGVLSVANGGTGWANIVAGTIPYGNGGSALSTSSALTFDGTKLLATYASSTAIAVSGTLYSATASTTNLTVSSIRSALHLGGTDGAVSAYGGTSCTNQFVRSLNGAGAATCQTVTLTSDVTGVLPVANGGTGWANIVAGTIPYGNGGSAVSTSSAFTFDGTKLIATYASSTAASVSGTHYAGTASSTSLIVSGVRSALHLAGADGTVSAYAGFSNPCTNQVFTTLSAVGAGGGCTSVADAWITGQIGLSHGGTNASLSGANQIAFMNSGNTALSLNSNLLYLAGQGALITGTTTAQSGLATFGSSTAPQIMLSDNIAADPLWGFRNNGGNLSIASSSATATSSNTAFQINNNASAGLLVGTSTATTGIQFDLYTIATTSLRIDSNSATKGGCIVMKDTDGVGYTYVTANNGVLTASATSCL